MKASRTRVHHAHRRRSGPADPSSHFAGGRPVIRRVAATTGGLLTLLVIACGSSETVTVTEDSAAPAGESDVERAPESPKPEKDSALAADPGSEDDFGGADVGVVPQLVGVDHQLAQDTLQAEGFYFIDEIDCSGADRLLLWDRNWKVVEQKPPAGTKASLEDTITLCSVKDGEQ